VSIVPSRLPWDVASQVATLDNLSGGRAILAVGLGAPDDRWWLFEDDPGRKVRAERLDEGLDLVTRLWSGEPVSFEGAHYRARPAGRLVPPPTVQRPRVPIWVVGAWPRPRSMRRAARWDGWLPYHLPPEGEAKLTPEVLRAGVDWVVERRSAAGLSMDGYDVVAEGTTDAANGEEAAAVVRSWAAAGATWWLEADWSSMDPAAVRAAAEARLSAGPPRP
jgi:alkanesulfonate monooxygenase SsuD/methylene tetrahydromethanopterin reductase-like flavin-dependent oxidoreductase (luciferase family)